MKLSSNTIGTLIFAALASTVFFLMVMRPSVEGNAINLGMPIKAEMVATEIAETTEKTQKQRQASQQYQKRLLKKQ